jgi:glycosyltransferase involved in cell wall biosynthesis
MPFTGSKVGTAHHSGVSASDVHLLTPDSRYKTEEGRKADMGMQAWSRGLLSKADLQTLETLSPQSPKDLIDNYTYVRKYYRGNWTFFVLVRRLLNLHNPFKEITAFLKTASVKYEQDVYRPLKDDSDYLAFSSTLVKEAPLISIIIPTLNRYQYLRDVLLDLQKQDYPNIEVIVVDQTDEPDRHFYSEFTLRLTAIFQEGKGQWLSRNEAIRNSSGRFLLFFDDDSRVDPDWVTQHLKALDYFNVDISAGVSISKVGDRVPQSYSYFRWADQFDSGNALVKREVFEKIGMFDRQFDKMRMGDGEFGLRSYLNGFHSISNPYAKRLHLKVDSGGLREMKSWDSFKAKNIFTPNPIPSAVYYFRKYYPPAYVRSGILIGLLPSLIPYRLKHKRSLYPLALLALVLVLPITLIQLYISWNRSGRMLKEGDKIDWK